jgi:hypothetical protein
MHISKIITTPSVLEFCGYIGTLFIKIKELFVVSSQGFTLWWQFAFGGMPCKSCLYRMLGDTNSPPRV